MLLCALLSMVVPVRYADGQQAQSAAAQEASSQLVLPNAPDLGTLSGTVTDTDGAFIPGAQITLEDTSSKETRTIVSDSSGSFIFDALAPAHYLVKITASGFAAWKVDDIVVQPGENFTLPPVSLGVESINASVNAIFQEDLAEQQISAEEKQRILGILPNFYVSYIPHAEPLTRRQKFKLAVTVSIDPLTFFTTGVTAGIEQAQNAYSGYGQQFKGYVERYGATYGDRLSATMLGSALLPSLLHQDPRYFYNGKGSVVHRALYAIVTTVICKGDDGRWQPNYSNVIGNLAAGQISALYYPKSDRHTAAVTLDNTLLGIAEGSIGTLFQEFLLRHVTHGAPPKIDQ